jgi:phosphoserine phosphatase
MKLQTGRHRRAGCGSDRTRDARRAGLHRQPAQRVATLKGADANILHQVRETLPLMPA